MSELPAGWTSATLDELAEFNPKHDPGLNRTLEVTFVPMPAVDADAGEIVGATGRPLGEVWKGFTHFADDDVIFAKITPCMENGKIAVASGLTNGRACGSTEFHVLRSRGGVLPQYLWRFLRQQSFRDNAEGAMTGAVGQRRVPTDYLREQVLPLPPLAEQQRIVAKLDTLITRGARARADLDRVPALAKRQRQSFLGMAFRGELTREWRRERGVPDPDMASLDNLTANLRRGRFLLLLVGDGIRERVEAIADYLQAHAGLHFSLGLVELPIYELPNGGGRIVAPRVLAHTHIITRTVVALPDGHTIQDEDAAAAEEAEVDPETVALGDARQAFWTEFLKRLQLDDPEQPVGRPPRQGYVTFTLPAPGGTSWLTVYRNMAKNEVGLFLSSHRDTPGEYARRVIGEDWATVGPRLGGTASLTEKNGVPVISDAIRPGNLDDPAVRARAFDWLTERTNTFINVLRPRVRSAVADYQGQ